jgi:hypothetical protein
MCTLVHPGKPWPQVHRCLQRRLHRGHHGTPGICHVDQSTQMDVSTRTSRPHRRPWPHFQLPIRWPSEQHIIYASSRSSDSQCWYKCHGEVQIEQDTFEFLHSKTPVPENCTAAKLRGVAVGIGTERETQTNTGKKFYASNYRGSQDRRQDEYWISSGTTTTSSGTLNTLSRFSTRSC